MNNKRKICILTLSMGSGGAERVISLIIPLLIEKYDVTLVLFNNLIHYELPSKELKILYLNKGKKLSFVHKIILFPYSIYKYISFMKKNNITVSISFLTRPNSELQT
jgi:N-acetylgalactosamine-N,N'-diacetylbacillosaminyl-diphospho-undecaprenol 4-alpha-N-acetylgalactosaminyltransferase